MGKRNIFTKIFKSFFRSVAIFSLLIVLFVVSWPTYASNNYYDDSSGTAIIDNVFASCSGCHDSASNACVDTMAGDTATSFLGYSGV